MLNKSIVHLQALVTINPKDLEIFKSKVEAVAKIVAAEGPENVLTHQTYQQSGSFNCLIIEAYKDEQVFLNHLSNIKSLSEIYPVNWKVKRMELSGAYSAETVNLLKAVSEADEFTFYSTAL